MGYENKVTKVWVR